MNHRKKVLTLLLTGAVLLAPLLSAGAAFRDAASVADAHKEAVEYVKEKGFVSGFPDGSFRPTATLTRAQAAKILCVALEGADAIPEIAETGFSDVPASHWASGCVAYCAEKGIVSGVGGGKFEPDGLLTAAAFARMLLVAYGRADEKMLIGEGWAVNTQNAMEKDGRDDGVETANVPTTRENACHMLYNFLRGDEPQDTSERYLAARAVRPTLAQRPRETDFSDETGRLDWDAFLEAQQKWRESGSAQRKDADVYRGRLDGFLTAGIPVFLDGERGKNRVCSPLNIYLALAMLAEATEGETRAQLLTLLGAKDTALLRWISNALWNANYVDDGVSASLLASSLWMNREIDFVQPTLDTLAEAYHASSYRGEMGSREFDAALQDWVNANTGGLLQEDVKEIELSKDTLLSILTTIYLKAPWAEEFTPAGTAPAVFHAPDGDRTCDYLNGRAGEEYYRGKRFTAAGKRLLLGDAGGVMWFLLPDEGVSPEELLRDEDALRFLTAEKREWEDRRTARVRLHLPKFDVQSKTDLIEGLKTLGVTDVFVPGVADFSPAFRNAELLAPSVSKVEHAARAAVDEQGVVAAAYTQIDIVKNTAIEPEFFDLTLDRPFLFAISGADGLPLFVGIVNQPA